MNAEPARRGEARRGEQAQDALLWEGLAGRPAGEVRELRFRHYAGFARQLARRELRARPGADLEFPDLCQLAYVGLLEAIDRYEPQRGAPFRAFAAPRIRGALRDGISRSTEVRQQVAHRQRVRRERVKSLIPPSEPQAAQSILAALTELAVGLAVGFMLEGTKLYEDGASPDRGRNAYESLAWKETGQQLAAAVDDLSEAHRRLIHDHYYLGLDFALIAQLRGVSRGRISQQHRAALASLAVQLTEHAPFTLRR